MSEKKQILIVSTAFGTEESELKKPYDELRKLGHDVALATPHGQDVQTMKSDKDLGEVIKADLKLADANPEEYDVLVIPGGTINADNARMDEDIRRITVAMADMGKVVAAICHGPWVLVDTKLAEGKTMTSYVSIRPDLANAGANVQDRPIVTCGANGWTLLTSRTPDDLKDFIEAIDAA